MRRFLLLALVTLWSFAAQAQSAQQLLLLGGPQLTVTVPQGLVARYLAGSNPPASVVGTTAFCLSVAGCPNGTTSGSPTVTPAPEGSGLKFNGTSAKVTLATSASLNQQVFTYTTLINPPDRTVYQMIVSGSANLAPQFRANITTGVLELDYQGSAVIGTSSSAVPVGAWSCAAVSYSATGNYVFYINGVAAGTGTSLRTFTFGTFLLGHDGGTIFANATLNDTRIYSRVLLASEVAQVCTANLAGLASNDNFPTPGLIVVARGDDLAAANDNWRIPLRRVLLAGLSP